MQVVGDISALSRFVGVLTRFMFGEEEGRDAARRHADGPDRGRRFDRRTDGRQVRRPRGSSAACPASPWPTSSWRPIWPGRRSSAGGATGGPGAGRHGLRPDPATGVAEPGAGDTVGFLGSFTDLGARRCPSACACCSAQVARLAALGYDVRCAFELELFVLEESIGEARALGFKRLTPLGGHDPKPLYVMQRAPEYLPLMRQHAPPGADGDHLGGVQRRGRPGQFELNLAPADP